jgi:hypothetical protein
VNVFLGAVGDQFSLIDFAVAIEVREERNAERWRLSRSETWESDAARERKQDRQPESEPSSHVFRRIA